MARSKFMVKNTPLVAGLPVGWIYYEEWQETDHKGTPIRIHRQQAHLDPQEVQYARDRINYVLGGAFRRALMRCAREQKQAQN